MKPTTYSFASELSIAINSGLSRSLVLHGNTNDLFHFVSGEGSGEYVPLVTWLTQYYSRAKGIVQIVAELNGPLRFYPETARDEVKQMWINWRSALVSETAGKPIAVKDLGAKFDEHLQEAIKNPSLAVEFLRQLTIASRQSKDKHLIIYFEAANMIVPSGDGDISRLNENDKHRISVLTDWFMDMDFMNGYDTVILITKSSSQIHSQITELPQVVQVQVPSPSVEARANFAEWFQKTLPEADRWGQPVPRPTWNAESLALQTGGLSTLALRQLLVEAGYRYPGQAIPIPMLVSKIESFIISQTGPGTVEFKRPLYNLDKVIGQAKVKKFLREQLIPQCMSGAIRAFLVTGSIGSGKTFIVEGMAGEMSVPVMIIKGVRDQWYGGTDKKTEAIRRACESVGKLVVVFDEADTKFGKLSGPNVHETDARLTGAFQEMMSDPRLNVIWCLMTARPYNLSADLKREGRAGDLTFPILDPEPESADRDAFIKWVISVVKPEFDEEDFQEIRGLPRINRLSAAGFKALREKAKANSVKSIHDLRVLMHNIVEPDTAEVREYQTLQALLHTTWIPLLPDSNEDIDSRRDKWRGRILQLEQKGIH
jgi:hypothetical protein